MKLLAFLLALSVSSIGSIVQETLSEPEFADVFFRLDAGKLLPLERQTAAIQGKASGFIPSSPTSPASPPATSASSKQRRLTLQPAHILRIHLQRLLPRHIERLLLHKGVFDMLRLPRLRKDWAIVERAPT